MRIIDADLFEVVYAVGKQTGNEDFVDGMTFVLEKIDNAPTLDLQTVQHGRWLRMLHENQEPYCSVCHKTAPFFTGYGYFTPACCPSCGAKLDRGPQMPKRTDKKYAKQKRGR